MFVILIFAFILICLIQIVIQLIPAITDHKNEKKITCEHYRDKDYICDYKKEKKSNRTLRILNIILSLLLLVAHLFSSAYIIPPPIIELDKTYEKVVLSVDEPRPTFFSLPIEYKISTDNNQWIEYSGPFELDSDAKITARTKILRTHSKQTEKDVYVGKDHSLSFGGADVSIKDSFGKTHYYSIMYGKKISWTNARSIANNYDGYLVQFDDEEEFNNVIRFIESIESKNIKCKEVFYFIGGLQKQSDHHYHWASSDYSDTSIVLDSQEAGWIYDIWFPGEPSGTYKEYEEHYMQLHYSEDNKRWGFNDVPDELYYPDDEQKIGFIVEWDSIDDVPESVNYVMKLSET